MFQRRHVPNPQNTTFHSVHTGRKLVGNFPQFWHTVHIHQFAGSRCLLFWIKIFFASKISPYFQPWNQEGFSTFCFQTGNIFISLFWPQTHFLVLISRLHFLVLISRKLFLFLFLVSNLRQFPFLILLSRFFFLNNRLLFYYGELFEQFDSFLSLIWRKGYDVEFDHLLLS